MNHYQRIKDLREDHDLNQRQLAQILQTTQHQISKYETGKQMMGIDKYIKLAKHFNVSLDYLAGLIDFPEKLERQERMYFLIAIITIIIVLVINDKKSNKSELTNNKLRKNISPSEIKGQAGEEHIIKLLGDTIPGQRYIVNNLIVQDQEGNTSQIDHIFINSNGIFVIETKNLSGTIYGNDTRKEWTQVFNYGKQKYRFYNPIMQNKTHIRRLREATGTGLPIRSIVVFANNNIESIRSNNVYTVEGMICEINAYFRERILPEEMDAFYNQLCQIKANQIPDEEHIDNVNKARETI